MELWPAGLQSPTGGPGIWLPLAAAAAASALWPLAAWPLPLLLAPHPANPHRLAAAPPTLPQCTT